MLLNVTVAGVAVASGNCVKCAGHIRGREGNTINKIYILRVSRVNVYLSACCGQLRCIVCPERTGIADIVVAITEGVPSIFGKRYAGGHDRYFPLVY